MPARKSRIAKITPPQTCGIFQRERVFRLLDESRLSPVEWVAGPAGSGKTTLAASYLESRGLPCLWYQIDEGDGDLASFFYYLGLAAKTISPRSRKPLPLLTPEYLQGIPVFSRRYFENLFQRLPVPFAVVFDNYQDVLDRIAFDEMMAHALDVVPRGVRVIVLCRSVPSSQFVRMQANNRLHLLGWDEIRFTLEESEEFLNAHCGEKPVDELLELLHRKTEGWAAGLVLLMAWAKTRSPEDLVRVMPQGVFDYFANEIFDRRDPVTQDVLLKTAFLDKIDPWLAKQLTGVSGAGGILEQLQRDQYFIRMHDQSYQYHSLFREFLLSRAKALYSTSQRALIRKKGAALLEAAGEFEHAASLYRKAGDWEGIVRLVLRHAPALVSQGRWQTLGGWMDGMPSVFTDAVPWLLYWLGVSRLPFNPAEAMGSFEKAFEAFRIEGDKTGMLLSCSSAIDSIVQGWEDFTPLDTWIDRMESCLAVFDGELVPEVAVGAMLSLAAALYIRRPFRDDLGATMEKAVSLAEESGDINLRFKAYLVGQNYYCWMGETGKALLMSDEAARLFTEPAVSPLLKLTWMLIDSGHSMVVTASYDKVLQRIEEAFALARQTGVHVLDHLFSAMAASALLCKGETEQARRFLEQFQALLNPSKRNAYSLCHYEWAWYHLLTGNASMALSHITTALRIAEETGYIFTEILARLAHVLALHAIGKTAEAKVVLVEVGKTIERTGSFSFRFHWLLASAQLAFAQAEEAKGLDLLREGMELGSKNNFSSINMWWQPDVMSSLCARAMRAGIQTSYTERMIRNHRLMPPHSALEPDSWPWSVRLFALGRFELLGSGGPVDYAGKKRQVELLKALVALGGTSVPVGRLIDFVWPDAQGDDGNNAFKTTLSRLRRLLPDEAIDLQDGALTLNRYLVWTDVSAFEQLAGKALGFWEQLRGPGAAEVKGKKLASDALALTGGALALYRGPFLEGDTTMMWAVSMRERLRSRFLRLMTIAGHHLERKRRWKSAVAIYQKALEAEDLHEEFYQRLMVCHRELGNRADALAVYERCRARLSGALDIAPSPTTEAIRTELRGSITVTGASRPTET
jgi:ATP/maltotriose-dependent transcriptional regulator MalT/DNA-binding SARP family transcriptional activator